MNSILIVDDDKKLRRIYNEILCSEGYTVLEASDANQAAHILKENNIDLVLLDIDLPGINGKILYETIKQFYKAIKVIVISVYSIEEQKNSIADANDYFDKSENLEVLVGKIRDVFSGNLISQ